MRLPHFNASQPLGLPPGSVRAIIALVLVFVVAQQILTGQDLSEPLLTITAVVLTFYFKERGNEPPVPYEAPLPDPVVD